MGPGSTNDWRPASPDKKQLPGAAGSEVVTTTTEEILRRLALQDESFIQTVLAMRMESNEARLHQKTQAIAP